MLICPGALISVGHNGDGTSNAIVIVYTPLYSGLAMEHCDAYGIKLRPDLESIAVLRLVTLAEIIVSFISS